MKDVATLTAAAGGAAVSVGAGELLLGLPVDALLGGLMGGVVAVLVIPPKRADGLTGLHLYLTLASTVLVAVLSAAALGPYTAALLHVDSVPRHLELWAFSFLWGAGAQAGLLLAAVRALRRRISQLGGIQEKTTQ